MKARFVKGWMYWRRSVGSRRRKRGGDWFGKSEYFFGLSIKPPHLDFELFHQSAAIHPDETLLEEYIKPLGIGQLEAARELCVSLNRLNEIVLGKARYHG